MKKGLLLIALVIFVLVITGCNKKSTKEFKLEIKESSWSGFSENYEPKEVTNEYGVVLDKEYSIDTGLDTLTFTIKKVNDDSIVINTTNPYSDYEDRIDLNTNKKEFTIYLNKTTKLTEPSMDAGSIYYLTLKDK